MFGYDPTDHLRALVSFCLQTRCKHKHHFTYSKNHYSFAVLRPFKSIYQYKNVIFFVFWPSVWLMSRVIKHQGIFCAICDYCHVFTSFSLCCVLCVIGRRFSSPTILLLTIQFLKNQKLVLNWEKWPLIVNTNLNQKLYARWTSHHLTLMPHYWSFPDATPPPAKKKSS